MQSISSQWPQNYQEILDSIDPDLTMDGPSDVAPSPKSSPKASSKGSTGKAMKRRSRASKKAPTTLLKADANNFRALVQQFTGFHSTNPPFGSIKGPINLNFEQSTYNYYPMNMEAAEAKQKQQKLVDQKKEHNFYPAAVNVDDDDEKLFSVRDYENPGAETLNYDGYDVEEIWGQEMSGSGDYSGTIEDDLWGY